MHEKNLNKEGRKQKKAKKEKKDSFLLPYVSKAKTGTNSLWKKEAFPRPTFLSIKDCTQVHGLQALNHNMLFIKSYFWKFLK